MRSLRDRGNIHQVWRDRKQIGNRITTLDGPLGLAIKTRSGMDASMRFD